MTQTQRVVKPMRMLEDVFPLSVEQYHTMIRVGILTDDDPVELLEGGLVFHMPTNPPHELVVEEMEDAVKRLLSADWFYRKEGSLTLEDSEPKPDGLVIRGKRRDYSNRHPGPRDVALVIEVSDSTLDRDRGIKLRNYARAGIETYWIVNLSSRQIEAYSLPLPTGTDQYLSRQDFGEDDDVPVTIDGRGIGLVRVRDVLP